MGITKQDQLDEMDRIAETDGDAMTDEEREFKEGVEKPRKKLVRAPKHFLMTFGEYAHFSIRKIPDKHLQWMISKSGIQLNQTVLRLAKAEYEWRKATGNPVTKEPEGWEPSIERHKSARYKAEVTGYEGCICSAICMNENCGQHFYWFPEGRETKCVHCPHCYTHHRCISNQNASIQEGIVDYCNVRETQGVNTIKRKPNKDQVKNDSMSLGFEDESDN